jgi:predicted PurR-regulated permease PerM
MSTYVQKRLPELGGLALENFRELLDNLRAGFRRTMGHISSAFFVFIVFVYAIQSFHAQMDRLRNLVPESHRERVSCYLGEIDRNMRAFLKGQLAVIVIISIISIIAYSIIRIPLALLVGLLAGLCNAIPTVGPIIGGGIAVLASIVGFVAGTYGLTWFLIKLALVLGIAFAIQLLDNSLISPKIMSSAIDVHPLVVIFAILLSASLVGIWGAVLAIPGIVVVKGIIKASCDIRAERAADEMGIETGSMD